MKRFLMAAAAACCVAGAVSPAQALVIGTADSTNSYPFGSAGGGYYYQQIYSAGSFSGATNISQITFYNSLSPSTATPLSDTFTFFLSTTSAAVATFDTATQTFPDASFTQVFSGAAPAIANGRLTFNLSTPFSYNPTVGNLVLTVRDFTAGSGGNLFLDTDRNVGVTNIRISAFPYDFNQGLVTGFNDFAAVPEPATWAMTIGGFALMGAALRRRRSATARPVAA